MNIIDCKFTIYEKIHLQIDIELKNQLFKSTINFLEVILWLAKDWFTMTWLELSRCSL